MEKIVAFSDPFTTTIEIWLYYVCTVMIYTKILNAKYKRSRLYISYLITASMLVLEPITRDSFMYLAAVYGLLTIDIFLCRWTVKDSSVRVIFKIYAFLFLYNILVNVIVQFFVSLDKALLSELIVHIVTFIFTVIICYTGIGKKIRLVIRYTSGKITSLILIMMLISGLMGSMLISEPLFSDSPGASMFVKCLFMVFVILFSLIVIAVMMYSITNKLIKSKAESYEKQIESQYDYYLQLSASYLELRRFRHDFKNMQIGLKKLLAENKTKAALEMLEAMSDASKTNIIYDTGSGVVDALLNMKQGAAEKINANIIFEGAVPVNAVEPVELCIIFGNSIDNAIEACAHIDKQQKKDIHVSSKCAGGLARIEITNPVSERVKINGLIPETTKPDAGSHGLGLYSIMKIIEKYDGKMHCESSDSTFKLLIELFFYEKPEITKLSQ